MQSQPDSDYEEEYEGSSDDILAGDYPAAVKQDTFQFGFDSSKPGQNDKDSNLVVTVIDRSSVHKIGIRWCCCHSQVTMSFSRLGSGVFGQGYFPNRKSTRHLS